MKGFKNASVTGAGPRSTDSMVCSMWGELAWLNSLWREVDNDFLIESLMITRPPAYKGREGEETLLRKFSRIEVIATGNLYYYEANLYPSREFLMFTKRLANLGEKQIIRLTEASVAETRLRIALPADSSYLRYRAQDESVLSIEWSGENYYAYYDPKDSSSGTAVPAEYADYYDRQKKIEVAIMPRPGNAKLQDLYIYMMTLDSLRDRLFAFLQQPVAYENLAGEMRQHLAPASQAPLFGLFPESSFPEVAQGKAPVDNAWLSHLITPPGSTEPDSGMITTGGWQSRYKQVPKKPWNPSEVSIAEPRYKIAPHSQVFHAGDDKEQLGFVATSMPGANWSVAGDAGGTIVKEGNDHFYVPAIRPPGIAFKVPGGTLIPAATRASLPRLPARTDVLTATGDGVSTSVSFVTTFTYPTNFIRFTRQGDALQLSCRYFNADSEEVPVPPDSVEWHILAGNGVISAEGVFTPASAAPSAVTVVMAVDARNLDEWRFAVTIIPLPLLSLRDVLRLQQE
ncbi:hypothetical protein IR012_01145 [Pseudomonas putida]|uniref:hypothetical protein n=1 Tax=Pseudomonas putida TaxID=303 RepID=UPI0018AA0126|nr:hypothetical protein [Pseudomonas putida]MBF8668950.1 hypothetical protein [Pseudomonas putida]MBF8710919.1 hypothetical protein [Pseudomonas putida]